VPQVVVAEVRGQALGLRPGRAHGALESPLLLAQTTGPGVSLDWTTAQGTSAFTTTAAAYLCSYALPSGLTHSFLARDLTELTSMTDVGSTVTGAGANYVGGNYKNCTFNGASAMGLRLLGTFTTTLNPMPGTYRALLRVVFAAGPPTMPQTFRFQMGVLGDGGTFYQLGDDVSVDLTGNAGADRGALIDLGLFQFPPGTDIGPVGLEPASSVGRPPNVQINAASPGSSPDLRFDELYLLPVDTTYGVASTAIFAPPVWGRVGPYNTVIYDGVNDAAVSRYDSTGSAPFAGVPAAMYAYRGTFVGGLPFVRPGWNNYLMWLFEDTVVTDTTVFTARYYPRYAYLRPATT
jgi:hypothetical protein